MRPERTLPKVRKMTMIQAFPWTSFERLRTTDRGAVGRSVAESLATAFAAASIRVFDGLFAWQRRAADRRALLVMDDHLLRDIGLSRADIEAEASKPFWHG